MGESGPYLLMSRLSMGVWCVEARHIARISYHKQRNTSTERSFTITMQVAIPWTNQANIDTLSLPGLPVGLR